MSKIVREERGGHSLESFTRYEAMAGRRQEDASSSTRVAPHHDLTPSPPTPTPARYSPRTLRQRQTYFSSDRFLAFIASMFHVESMEPVPNPVPLAQ